MLLERLPPESAMKTAIRDSLGPDPSPPQDEDGDAEWAGYGPYSNTDMHLGQLVDEVRWLRYAVYHAQGGKPARPHQYPRPGVIPPVTKRLSPAGRDFLMNLRLQRAARAATPAPAADVVPEHIKTSRAKQLGPAERAWLRRQLRGGQPPPPTAQ